jgi:hypothetical protein
VPNVVVPAIAPLTNFEPVQTRTVESAVDAMTEETIPRFETSPAVEAPPTLPSAPDQPTLPIVEAPTPRNLPEIPPVTNALQPDSSLVLVETRHDAPPIWTKPQTRCLVPSARGHRESKSRVNRSRWSRLTRTPRRPVRNAGR